MEILDCKKCGEAPVVCRVGEQKEFWCECANKKCSKRTHANRETPEKALCEWNRFMRTKLLTFQNHPKFYENFIGIYKEGDVEMFMRFNHKTNEVEFISKSGSTLLNPPKYWTPGE